MITQVVSALFNACWQGLAIVAVTATALRFFSRSSAATRYAIWFTALVAVAALPAIDFGLARVSLAQPAVTASPAHFTIVRTAAISYPVAHARSSGATTAAAIPTTTIGYAVTAAPGLAERLQTVAAGIADRVGAALSSVALPFALAWLLLSGIMLYRLALAYARLRRVKGGLRPLVSVSVDHLVANSKRPVSVGVAADLTMPCVLGFAKPAIALPARLARELTADDLERIVRHEHAHVRRWDDVANALQLIVQAVMCLNPAVHLIGRSLNVEREIACDDFAVEPLAERVQYAKCLTHIAVNGFGRGSALPAPGFFFNRKQLLVRVERLLERGHNGSTKIATTARFALAGLALVVIAVARVQLPVVAASVAPTTPVVPTLMVGHTTAVVPTLMVGHTQATHVATSPVGTTTIHVGASTIHVPATTIHVPATTIHVPATTIHVPATTIQVAPAFTADETKRFLHLHSVARRLSLSMAPLQRPVLQIDRAMIQHQVSVQTKFRYAFKTMAASVASFAQPAPLQSVAQAAPAAPAAPTGHASSGGDFLDALAAAGYKNLSVDDLVQLKNVGVDGGLIDAAVSYSGSRPSVEMLVRMASVGVDADFLRHLQSSGYPRMSLEDVVRMRSVGVDPNYIRDMTAVLHVKPSIEQLTQLRALGVDPDYVRSFVQLGYDKLSPNDLMRLRAVGVDADYVRMLRSKGIGGSGLSVEDLVRMKSVGVE